MHKFVLYLAVLCTALSSVQAEAYDSAEEGLEQLQQLSDAFASVAARVEPGVVAIVAEKTMGVASRDPFQGTPFERFFGNPRGSRPREERRPPGQGSGVIVRHEDDYYILTNNHVVKGADEIWVELTDERHFEAEVVGADSLSDLAVLKVDAEDLPVVPLGDSDEIKVGQWVLAVGNPFGYEHTVTSGIVSALGRRRFGDEYGSFVQTDAAINPGNSGGPLVNLRGEVVGINTAIAGAGNRFRGTMDNAGIGFAIPVNLVRDVLQQLVEHGEVRRGLLGVLIGDISSVMAEALGMENTQGVLINKVLPDGAADKADMEQGDVVLALDGKSVRSTTELKSRIGQTSPGTRVELLVLWDGKEKKIKVVLDQRTQNSFPARPVAAQREGKLGLVVQDLTSELAQRLGYEGERGILVRGVVRGSEAARRGLQQGDLIQEVDRQPVDSVEDYGRELDKVEGGKAVLLLVRRGGTTSLVALRMPRE